MYAKCTHELNQAFVPNLLVLINLFAKRNLFAYAYFPIFWSFSCTFVSCHFECNLQTLVDQDWDWFSHRLNLFLVYLQYNYSWWCYILSRVATLSGMLGMLWINRNLRNIAKKSRKCKENWSIFSNARQMSDILYDAVSGDVKKESNVK